MQKRIPILACLTLLASALASSVVGQSDPDPNGVGAAAFAQNMALDHLYDIEAGVLASQRGTATDIKKMGAVLVRDAASDDRQLLLAVRGTYPRINLPGALDKFHQQKIDRLRTLQGRDFDREFIMQQMEVQSATVANLSSYSRLGMHANLKAYAATTLPDAQQQLKNASILNAGPLAMN
jgi:putative membrane protein